MAATSGLLATGALNALTDYEGGAVPTVGFGTHRALDAAIGLALLRAGRASPMLAALGVGITALAAGSAKRAAAGPPDTAYRPLGVLKPVADGVWCVDDVLHGSLPVRMTVLLLGDGGLLLHSPTAFSPALRDSLRAIGPIRHLVAPSVVHWMFVKPWQDAEPEATVWAAPGLAGRAQVARAGLRIDHVLDDRAPAAWADEIEQAVVRGPGGFAEVVMLHRPSRTVVLTDLVQNLEVARLPWGLRPVAAAIGVTAPHGRAPAYLRALVRWGGQGREAARRIVAWTPQHVMLTHGAPVSTDAARWLRRSLGWLTR